MLQKLSLHVPEIKSLLMRRFKHKSAWHIKITLMMLSAIGILSCATKHHAPYSEIIPPVRNIFEIEKRLLRADSSSHHISMVEIGRIHYDNDSFPIWMVSYKPFKQGLKKILINGGVHGNEPAGSKYALQLIDAIADNPEKFGQFEIDIIPIVNPWGWVHDIRHNQKGIDINRDFASFNSQEAKIIERSLVGKSYDLMLDLHEDPRADGFYLWQYGLENKTASAQVVSRVQSMGYPIEQNISFIALKTKNGIIDAPMWGIKYTELTRQMSIANYYRRNHSQRVYTVETPTRLPMEDRLIMQGTAVEMIIESIAE